MHPELQVQPPRLLPLDYDPQVPVQVIAGMERVCKAAGLPLEQIELLGQDEAACRDFVHLADLVGVESAILTTDWLLLESRWQDRRQG